MRVSLLLVTAALCLGTGCASTLSTLQTATPAKRGQVQVTGGAGLYLPVGPVITVVEQGITQGKAVNDARQSGETYELTEEAQQELLTAGLALAIMAPWSGPSYELSVRTGILPEDWDVGLRYSVNAFRLDTKYRLFHYTHNPELPEYKRANVDVSLGLGVSKYLFENPALKLLKYVQLDKFSRWDLEVPLYTTIDLGDIFKFYGALKYVYNRTSIDATLVNYSQHAANISGVEVGLPRLVHSHFFGASAGVAAGYKYAHVMLELTGGYTHCAPYLFGRRRQLGGATFYPAIGLGLKFP
jgi:hypothetical protein